MVYQFEEHPNDSFPQHEMSHQYLHDWILELDEVHPLPLPLIPAMHLMGIYLFGFTMGLLFI